MRNKEQQKKREKSEIKAEQAVRKAGIERKKKMGE